jgi:hypothetical protein
LPKHIAEGISVGDIIDAGNNKIINVATPTSSLDAANKAYVDSVATALDWQDSVLDKDLTTSPGSPTIGDRYIIAGIGGAWATFSINDIVEYNGTSWNNYTPNEGHATWLEDEDSVYLYTGASWEELGSITNHSNLTGLANDDHTQYLLVDGTRAMSGALNLGSNNLTNVGTVNGVTIESHASRHTDGGTDELTAQDLGAGATTSGLLMESDGSGGWNLLTTSSISGGVAAHGDLTGLANDDHTQYLLVDGTRAMSGTLGMSFNNIIDANDVISSGVIRAQSKLEVASGDVEVLFSGFGLVMTSSDGTKFRLQIDNGGNLITTAI